MEFSVLMSIYKNTKVEEFNECIESILCQSIVSNDIVVVVDGEIPDELNEYIKKLNGNNFINFIFLPINVGLGLALANGILHCKNDLVARMDTDDIAYSDRFEKQLKMFEDNSDLDVCGGYITEFISGTNKMMNDKKIPVSHSDILKYMKKRNPFNHMTIMFKKKSVLDAGNYQDFHFNEDYFLWIRMMLNGAKFTNLTDKLVKVRMDEYTFQRRGGVKYYKQQKMLFRYMREKSIITYFDYKKCLFIRFIVQVISPNLIRKKMYESFART